MREVDREVDDRQVVVRIPTHMMRGEEGVGASKSKVDGWRRRRWATILLHRESQYDRNDSMFIEATSRERKCCSRGRGGWGEVIPQLSTQQRNRRSHAQRNASLRTHCFPLSRSPNLRNTFSPRTTALLDIPFVHCYPSSWLAYPSALQKPWTRSFASLLSNFVRTVGRVMAAWCGRLWGELIHCGVLWRFWGMIIIHHPSTLVIPIHLPFLTLPWFISIRPMHLSLISLFMNHTYIFSSSHTSWTKYKQNNQRHLLFIIPTITLSLRMKGRWEERGERWSSANIWSGHLWRS